MYKLSILVATTMVVAACDGSTDAPRAADGDWSDAVLMFDDADGSIPADGSAEPFGDGGTPEGGTLHDAGTEDADQAPSGDTRRTNGIGRACEVDTDCEDGQLCHRDVDDYLGHGQCTTPCSNSEQCATEHGEDTFCIGAEICVATCLVDADCPERSVCSDFDWCLRTGPGSGNPYCTGDGTPCSLLSGTECGLTLGCRDDSECAGISSNCFLQNSSYDCTLQDGCSWSTTSDSCSGVASSCSSQLGSGVCGLQEGCHWESACSGTRMPCSEMPVSLCAEQPGCSITY